MSDNKRLERIEADLGEIKLMLARLANPGSALSVEQKADELRKALATGDKQALRAAAKRISTP